MQDGDQCTTTSLLNASDIHQKWAIALRGLYIAHVKAELCCTAREDKVSPIKSFSLVQDGTISSVYVMSALQMMCLAPRAHNELVKS